MGYLLFLIMRSFNTTYNCTHIFEQLVGTTILQVDVMSLAKIK